MEFIRMPHCGLAVLIITTSQNLSHENSDFTKDCTPSALLPPVPPFQGWGFSIFQSRRAPPEQGTLQQPLIGAFSTAPLRAAPRRSQAPARPGSGAGREALRLRVPRANRRSAPLSGRRRAAKAAGPEKNATGRASSRKEHGLTPEWHNKLTVLRLYSEAILEKS